MAVMCGRSLLAFHRDYFDLDQRPGGSQRRHLHSAACRLVGLSGGSEELVIGSHHAGKVEFAAIGAAKSENTPIATVA